MTNNSDLEIGLLQLLSRLQIAVLDNHKQNSHISKNLHYFFARYVVFYHPDCKHFLLFVHSILPSEKGTQSNVSKNYHLLVIAVYLTLAVKTQNWEVDVPSLLRTGIPEDCLRERVQN